MCWDRNGYNDYLDRIRGTRLLSVIYEELELALLNLLRLNKPADKGHRGLAPG